MVLFTIRRRAYSVLELSSPTFAYVVAQSCEWRCQLNASHARDDWPVTLTLARAGRATAGRVRATRSLAGGLLRPPRPRDSGSTVNRAIRSVAIMRCWPACGQRPYDPYYFYVSGLKSFHYYFHARPRAGTASDEGPERPRTCVGTGRKYGPATCPVPRASIWGARASLAGWESSSVLISSFRSGVRLSLDYLAAAIAGGQRGRHVSITTAQPERLSLACPFLSTSSNCAGGVVPWCPSPA
jgi:hypothetical protein